MPTSEVETSLRALELEGLGVGGSRWANVENQGGRKGRRRGSEGRRATSEVGVE